VVVLGYTNESRRGHVDRLKGDARPSSLAKARASNEPERREPGCPQDGPTPPSDRKQSAG